MTDKHIRLDSQFSVVSAFWAPDATDIVYTGTLTVDERSIKFITAPEYIAQISSLPTSSITRLLNGHVAASLPVLHGFTAEGLCTLCHLVGANRPGLTDLGSGQSITATAYLAQVCVTGMHFGGLHDKCLKSARYTFTGLSEWLPKATTETWENDQVVIKVPLKAQDIVAIRLPDSDIRVSVKIVSELTSTAVDGARLSRSVACVDIEPPAAECLSWYFEIGNRLENLFSLLTGTSLALEMMFVYRGDESGHVIAKRNDHARPFDLFECVRCTPSQLANSMAIWLCESREFQSVENLALVVVRKGKLHVETEFLSLAQALEGFHRVTTDTVVVGRAVFRQVRKKITALLAREDVDAALARRICESMSHVNEPTFASRLTELCNRISSSLMLRMEIDPGKFVANVVDTRNFYTHAGSAVARRRRIPLRGTELFLLNQKMRAVLRGALLLHLGIPEEQLSDLLAREATRWRVEY
jgi:HEPN superfamily Apea-like protein/ApeA-like protein